MNLKGHVLPCHARFLTQYSPRSHRFDAHCFLTADTGVSNLTSWVIDLTGAMRARIDTGIEMWNQILIWLRSAPIADAVDRRNAPTMQLLFLLLGVSIPASWIYFLATGGVPTGGAMFMVMALTMALLAFLCVWMIRKGRFRAAVVLYLGALLSMQEVNHLAMGFQPLAMNQIDQFMMLIIGGLVLGRRALWTIFAALLVVAGSGFAVDVFRLATAGEPVAKALSNLPSLVFGYLLVALVLDRTITALRESLDESNARGRDLQREMSERERAQSQLIHAQKMEAAGRLASGIAHDFNNILDVVLGFSKQRHDALDLDGDPARVAALDGALEGVEVAARRGTAITRKLLSFSRNDVPKPALFDAGQALTELRPMLRQLFPPSVRLSLNCPGQPLPVRLDRSGFELMILNIAANARDAMPDGGDFRITALATPADGVRITLADSGHGMSETVKLRLFEPFFSTKSAAEGTGLGLAVIHDLLTAAGGEIRGDSEPGQGAVFTIRLPFALAQGDEVPAAAVGHDRP